MSHPDFPCFFLLYVIAVVGWQLSKYFEAKAVNDNFLTENEGEDLSVQKTRHDQGSGCLRAIGKTIAWLVILAIPFFIAFVLFVNLMI